MQRLLLLLAGAALLLPGLTAAHCGGPYTAIPRIQGDQGPSPLVGQTITTEGILTLDLRHRGGFGGFFLQQQDTGSAHPDSGTGTPGPASRGLFVETEQPAGDTGDRIRIRGTVSEAYGLTRLTGIRLLKTCGQAPLPAPVPVTLPMPADLDFRQLESMRVTLSAPLYITDTFDLGRYGELVLAPEVQPIPTQILEPGPEAMALAERQEQARLRLDDGSRQRNPRPVPYPPPSLAPERPLRIGDRVYPLTGVLDFRFGQWRIQPDSPPGFEATSTRPDVLARDRPDQIRIMSFNLENYFNGDGRGGGFPTARGAGSKARFVAQRARLTNAIRAVEPDVLAVMELENDGDGPDSALADLARALGEHWQFIPSSTGGDGRGDRGLGGGVGGDAIRVAFLYRADRVHPQGPLRTLNDGAFSRGNRPALAQDFRPAGRSATVRVVALHLKSKSCRNARGADQDQNDGQACFADLRTRAATELVDWLASLPRPDTLTGTLAGTLITGDLNSYARETPLKVLQHAGFSDLINQNREQPAISFRFRGRVGTLDYALADADLMPFVARAWIWAINAEEPRVGSVNEPQPPFPLPVSAATASPWRSSDHNPVIVDLQGL